MCPDDVISLSLFIRMTNRRQKKRNSKGEISAWVVGKKWYTPDNPIVIMTFIAISPYFPNSNDRHFRFENRPKVRPLCSDDMEYLACRNALIQYVNVTSILTKQHTSVSIPSISHPFSKAMGHVRWPPGVIGGTETTCLSTGRQWFREERTSPWTVHIFLVQQCPTCLGKDISKGCSTSTIHDNSWTLIVMLVLCW